MQNNKCQNECVFTSDKSMQHLADAILFTYRALAWNNVPSKRLPQQKYVFFNVEPPYLTFNLTHLNMPEYKEFFNLTMSYRRDSDIVVPYFHFEKFDTPLSDVEWEKV
jgi:alpha-1,3-fucosyltransferase